MMSFVKSYLKDHVTKKDICIDATTGNGYDTLTLCQLSKFVYGFDIQEKALHNTDALLKENALSNYKLLLDSHENIVRYNIRFKGVVFNLGYLPHSDKTITTTKETTLNTLISLIPNMTKDQFIIITCYPHKEGLIESEGILEYVKTLDDSFLILKYDTLSKNKTPFVLVIEKKKN